MKTSSIKIANILRNLSRFSMLTISILVTIFALLSGSEDYGGGITGIIKNSPNAIPWLVLLVLIYIAWKWELIGGILITIFGLFLMYFFNFNESSFHIVPFILTLLVVVFGSLFITSWYLRKK